MMRSFRTSNGRVVPADDISDNVWVRLTQPTVDEISLVAKTLNVDVTDVSASLDRDEGSRFEVLDNGILLLVDIPYENIVEGISTYDTIPLAIINSSKAIVTVCQMESYTIGKFSDNSMSNVTLDDRINFILKILYGISLQYQQYLRKISARCKEIEAKINHSTENTDIIELHQLELSSVYFITSLRACNVVLDKMNRYMEKSNKADLDLLYDVIIENEQAIEMATVYREVIDSARELFVAVMNNKLNSVMKWLTSITVILSIPMIISGIYGMNVILPLMYDKFAFIYVMIFLILVCTIGVLVLKRKKLL